MKSFYEFKGSWLYIFDNLVGVITPGNIQKFAIWQSKSVDKKNLLIVYGIRLDDEWETRTGINQISEAEFVINYRNKINEHLIHGFNEYNKNNPMNFLKRITAMF